jgi:hypothetical protein
LDANSIVGSGLIDPRRGNVLYDLPGEFFQRITFRALRSSIISALETDIDPAVKQVLVRKDVAEFEHSCALCDREEIRGW